MHQQRIQLFAAGLVIRHHCQRGVSVFVAPQIHAVNPALQRELVAAAQIHFPGRRAVVFAAKTEFRRDRIKFILPAHPADDDLDKILQRRRQRPRGKKCFRRIMEQPVAEMRHLLGGNFTDAFARRRWFKVTPAFAFRLELLVENFQDIVLEIAAFAGIQFKDFSFVRAQAGTDKKLERTLREFLQPADG